MIELIMQFFQEGLVQNRSSAARDELQLAAGALLIEMMCVDYQEDEVERQAITRSIGSMFSLSPEESAQLVDRAHARWEGATDYYEFTSRVNAGFSLQQKEALMEALWRVAYADGDIDKYERHYLGKIAELLYLPQHSIIAAKQRAQNTNES